MYRFFSSWASKPTGSGCCAPSTPVLALSFSTSTTPTTATTTTSKSPSPRSRLRCPDCTRGTPRGARGRDTADAPPGLPGAPAGQWREVPATGHYPPDKQLVPRLRVPKGNPAIPRLVPFVAQPGPTVPL